MAEGNLVAIVGIGAGALVALASPAITARATNRGQRRLFAHQKALADRSELREVLDHTSAAIAALERDLADLHIAYVARSGGADRCNPELAAIEEALHALELLCARVAIRLGEASPAFVAAEEARSRSEAIATGISNHLILSDIEPAPSSRAIETEIGLVRAAGAVFLVAARELVGSVAFQGGA